MRLVRASGPQPKFGPAPKVGRGSPVRHSSGSDGGSLGEGGCRALINSPARSRAFTLIELMVVMVLMGVMAAVILPEMTGSYEDALLRSASRELVNGFDLAYSQAVSLNQTHRVRLDRQRSRYVVERKLREDARGEEFVPVKEIPGSTGSFDPRIQILFRKAGGDEQPGGGLEPSAAAGENPPNHGQPGSGDDNESIAFYSDGTADAGEVILQDRDGFRLALQINAATARVHIVEIPKK